MRGKARLLAGTVVTALALSAAPAQADHHFMAISEVYPGTGANPDSAFIELQMYASGQDFVGGHQVKTYNAAGTENFSLTIPDDVDNGQNNRTILIGDSFANGGDFGDFFGSMGTLILPAGGAACFISTQFGPIDCVSWGTYNDATPPDPTGTPVAGTIPDGSSLTRRVDVAGCPTFLEGSDDTNDSVNDFTVTATETPNTNTDPIPTTACPNTSITKHPRKRTTKRRATFEFRATPASDSFQCKLDSAPFKDCDSPFSKRVSRGRHTFKVKATGDSSPASFSWKVVRP